VGAVVSYFLIPVAYYEFTGTVLIGQSPVATAPSSSTLLLAVAYLVTAVPVLVVVWAWFDQSIEVAFDMDFLHRDTLAWKRGMRWTAWAIILAEVAIGLFLPTNATGPLDVYFTVLLVLFAYAASVLFLSASRVRDAAMKGYVRWVGVMAASGVILFVAWPYFLLVSAYALYRASGSFTKTTALEASSASG
jgi:hypothetical protein